MSRWFGLILCAATLVAPAPLRADFDAGFVAYVSGDFVTAFTEWLPIAEDGHREAQFGVGMLYYKGQGTSRDLDQAARWFRAAAEQGSMRAQTQLGGMYARGDGVDAGWDEAIAWWRKAAAQGSERAQYQLGQVYQYGSGVERDFDEAKRWYKMSAAQGYGLARAQLSEVGRFAAETRESLVASSGGGVSGGGVEVLLTPVNPTVIYESPVDLATALAAGAAPLIPLSGVEASTLDQFHRIYLASFRAIEKADAGWRRLAGANGDLLAPLSAALAQVDLGRDKGIVYRLQAGPLADGADADALCGELIARAIPCVALGPE